MEHDPMALNVRLAERVRGLRAARGLTLDALAERSGVSRSMISLVERGESSPTAVVLERLSVGLGVTLASLFEFERESVSPLVRRAEQTVWRDPETGYVRRNLSPPRFDTPIELVEVEFPPGERIAFDSGPRSIGVDQQVWVLDGVIELTLGEETYRLERGDCLAMRLGPPISFHNPGAGPARYLVALTAEDRARAHR